MVSQRPVMDLKSNNRNSLTTQQCVVTTRGVAIAYGTVNRPTVTQCPEYADVVRIFEVH